MKKGLFGKLPIAGNSFVPIPFSKSLRISMKGKPRFYHILYEKYPYGTEIKTFTGSEDRDYLLTAINELGTDPWDDEIQIKKDTAVVRLNPNNSLSLLNHSGEGTIQSIVIEADGSEDFFQNVYLRVRFDDNRFFNINAPAGFFSDQL
jgi:hypothetical protein